MPDSLVIGNILELLGGGVASTHPQCAGAVFHLSPGWSLSSPQYAADSVASLLLGGGLPLGQHVDNRHPVLPVTIVVPSTGDDIADNRTLAGAREVLMQAVNADRWQMTWARGGGLTMVFDCFHADPAVVTYSLPMEDALISQISVSFDAMPFGRSDSVEQIPFNSPSTGWQPPPASVTIDGFTTVSSSTDAALFTQSTTVLAVGTRSLRWARSSHDCPNYTHTLTPLDITGRKKLSLWIGLGTSTYSQWHTGRATAAITLTDAAGNTVTTSITFDARASGLITAPRWQKISGLIPQVTTFDYTTVSSYQLLLWNKVEQGGQPVLQAEAWFDTLRADGASTGSPGARGAVYAIPGAIGTAPAPLSLQLQPGPSVVPTTQTFTTVGSNNWTSTLTGNVAAETWGAGSGGAGAGSDGAGGGAGGEYSYDVIPVTNATVYHPTVGQGGAAGNTSTHVSTAGGDSFFTGDSARTCRGHGGQPAGLSGNGKSGGLGGTGSNNARHFDGGDGKTIGSGATRGGGGGASGGTAATGGDATNSPTNEWTGGTAVDGGGPGGNGGRDPFTPHTGNPPSRGPGGGGGGGAHPTGLAAQVGGAGANGQVRLTYSSTVGSPLKTAVLHLPPRDAPHPATPMIVTGNGVDTPNGATTYTAPATGSLQARYSGTYQVILTNASWNTPSASRTVTVSIIQARADGTNPSVSLARTLVPNTDPDILRPLNGLLLLGTVTLPLYPIAPGNNTDAIKATVTDTNTSDRFYDLLLLSTEGQTIIYSSTSGAGVASLWVNEPDIGLDVGTIYGGQADWDQASSVLADCPVIAGGPMALVQGENPLLAYSVQGAPALQAWYQPRWLIDRLQ